VTAARKADLLGTAAFLVGLGPQVAALGCFLVANRLWHVSQLLADPFHFDLGGAFR
jgi:hypothetical protein